MATDFPFDLVASDLDGTLLRTDDKLSDRTKAAVHNVIERGATFVYATGRPPRLLDMVVNKLEHYGYGIASNGAYLLDLSIDDPTKRIIETFEIQPDAARASIALIKTLLPDAAFAVDGRDGFAHEPTFKPRFVLPRNKTRVAPIDQLLDRPYAKLMFRHPTMSLDVFNTITEVLRGVATLTFGAIPSMSRVLPDHDTHLEVQALGVSKAFALQRICEHLGRDHEQTKVVAFGDMPNDIDMITWASHGVALGNAHETVIAVADETTTSNDDDGVAVVLERELAASK
jgi:Cof subfamily protein (haloacid dehalogenase superfamily)